VRVLPAADGQTDTYLENITTDFSGTFRLVGAGTGPGGTVIQSPNESAAVFVGSASTVSFVRAVQTADHTSALGSSSDGARFENVVAEAPTGRAFLGAGTIRDSTLSGETGALTGAEGSKLRLVRTVVAGRRIGVSAHTLNGTDTLELLDCIVRGANDPTGAGIGASATLGATVTARLRHVTVLGYPTRVSIAGDFPVNLEAANSTFAADGGVDLSIYGSAHSASLTATNFSPARTVLDGGASMPATTQPIDVAPGLTADGHLAPGSPLIDQGASGGVLANDPDDGLDIDRQPRVEGPARDVGADEAGTAPSVPSEPEDDGATGGGSGGGGGGGGASGGGGGIVGDAVSGPRFALRFARTQRVLRTRAITLSITPEDAVRLTGSATITVPRGAAASVRLKGVRTSGVAGRTKKLKLKLSGRGLTRVRAALRRRKTLNAKVKIVAADAAGRKTTVTRKLKVRR
jgi:hypothetical protein